MADEPAPRSAPFDLTPEPTRPVVRKRRPGALLLLLGVVAAVVFVLLRSLGDASLFFYEVSEAVELRSELGDDRFRVVGTPQPGLVEGELGGEAAVVLPCAPMTSWPTWST